MKKTLLLGTLIPMLIIAFVISGVSIYSYRNSVDNDVEHYQQVLLKGRKSNIKDAALLGSAVIEDIVRRLGIGDKAREAANKALGRVRYFNDVGYFFAMDEKKVYIIHSLFPNLVGQALGKAMIDVNGINISNLLNDKSRSGGGFVQYIYNKPGVASLQPKVTYVSPITGSKWYIGTGLYIDDIKSEVEAFRKKANEQAHKQVKVIVVTSFSVYLCMFLLVVYISEKFVAPIRESARRDFLTGLLNRHAYQNIIKQKKINSLVIIDIDNFKKINDSNGHEFGDKVILNVAEAINLSINHDTDFAFRWGGEEFMVLTEAECMQAYEIAERVRINIEEKCGVTVSAGIFSGGFLINISSFPYAYKKADDLLYEAKTNGKNQIKHKIHANKFI